jgi:alkylation response protein AidB-like acyl-CoA dehydrogenase
VDLGLSDEQQELVASFANLLGKSSPTERVRACEPGGFDPALWRTLIDTGAVAMAVPEAHGGWGASLVDLALVAEQVGRAIAPAPLLEAQVAARLLGAVQSQAATDALAAAIAGDQLVTFAVHQPRGDVAALTPAGAICDAVVVRSGDRLLLAPVPDHARATVANLADAPLADVQVADAVELAAGTAAVAAFEAAIDEWLALTASAVVGVGTAAHELGCAYAAERKAFGAIIGTFQGVAHPLADDATNLDGARLLARKAAWAIDTSSPRARELAAMAIAFASDAAATATYTALHVHGGYGFMLEYDVQLYYRRARGWPRVWGDAEAAHRRAASARYGRTEVP